MAQAFGKTWWGSEWLKALTHIDYANRIPRGSAYAKKGAVRSIEVKGNVINVKLAESQNTLLTQNKTQTDLLEKLEEQTVSQQRELDELYKRLEGQQDKMTELRQQTRFFPTSQRRFSAFCLLCSAKAVPLRDVCKQLSTDTIR